MSALNVYGSGALGVLRVCVECVWLCCFGGSPCLC